LFKPLYGASMAKDYPELEGEIHHAAAAPTESAPSTAPPTASLQAAVR